MSSYVDFLLVPLIIITSVERKSFLVVDSSTVDGGGVILESFKRVEKYDSELVSNGKIECFKKQWVMGHIQAHIQMDIKVFCSRVSFLLTLIKKL